MKRTYRGLVVREGETVYNHTQGGSGKVIKVTQGGASVSVKMTDGSIVTRHTSLWAHVPAKDKQP